MVSKNKFGSVCCMTSLCHLENNSMGFSGKFSINDKPDVFMFVSLQILECDQSIDALSFIYNFNHLYNDNDK